VSNQKTITLPTSCLLHVEMLHLQNNVGKEGARIAKCCAMRDGAAHISGTASAAAPEWSIIFGLPFCHTQLDELRPHRRVRKRVVKSSARWFIPSRIMAWARKTAADASRDPRKAAAK
jgi:hypothetical protein